jgi:hypothetical protein
LTVCVPSTPTFGFPSGYKSTTPKFAAIRTVVETQ